MAPLTNRQVSLEVYAYVLYIGGIKQRPTKTYTGTSYQNLTYNIYICVCVSSIPWYTI